MGNPTHYSLGMDYIYNLLSVTGRRLDFLTLLHQAQTNNLIGASRYLANACKKRAPSAPSLTL
jgi:hypothetical protein